MIETPPASGAALLTAVYKDQPEDFEVNEDLRIDYDDAGEHLYLHVEKSGVNTDEIARLLEEVYAVGSADVGLSGLKDRHALTRQWFSVRTSRSAEDAQAALAGLAMADAKQARVLSSARHGRKLRRGAHVANDFRIVLRQVRPSEAFTQQAAAEHAGVAEYRVSEVFKSAVDARIVGLGVAGFPSYIGPQRFGHGGQNLQRARQWFRQPKKRTSRQQRSLWLSAARSALFNAVCAARVADGSWQHLLPGEPAVLAGTHSFFDSSSSDPAQLQERLERFDIHPSAPWWGRGLSLAKHACAEFEQLILDDYADLRSGLEQAGLAQERRALRAEARDFRHRWLDSSSLELNFSLPPGVFATTLLRELGLCNEPSRRETD